MNTFIGSLYTHSIWTCITHWVWGTIHKLQSEHEHTHYWRCPEGLLFTPTFWLPPPLPTKVSVFYGCLLNDCITVLVNPFSSRLLSDVPEERLSRSFEAWSSNRLETKTASVYIRWPDCVIIVTRFGGTFKESGYTTSVVKFWSSSSHSLANVGDRNLFPSQTNKPWHWNRVGALI